MLGKRLHEHEAKVWLVNTGWTGGPYGTGKRMDLAYTRAMVRGALAGRLDDVATEVEPVFGLHVLVEVHGVPPQVLRPRDTWSDGSEYDAKAAELAAMFEANFLKYADRVSNEVKEAGPSA